MTLHLSDFMTIRNEWRDQLLKEYAEQEFEDDGTMLEVNIDTGDEDECCEMIKQKYERLITKTFSYPRRRLKEAGVGQRVYEGIHWEWANPAERGGLPLSEFARFNVDCDRIRKVLETNAYTDRGTDRAAVERRMANYQKALDDWDECEKQKNSWKNELR